MSKRGSRSVRLVLTISMILVFLLVAKSSPERADNFVSVESEPVLVSAVKPGKRWLVIDEDRCSQERECSCGMCPPY